jgi:DNA-binding NarL/FixJ family response regulator
MIRVFIVAVAAERRAALEALLRGDARFSVVGNGVSMAASELSSGGPVPDVVLMDGSGDEKVLPVFRFGDAPPIVLLTEGLSRAQLRTALHRGVHAILGRGPSVQEISAALEAAAAGLTALGPEQADALLPPPARLDIEIAREPLTAREIEVLALLAEGAANKEIAHRLAVTEHTVKFHVSSILGKLGATSRTEAVREGIRRGWVLV